MIDNGAIAPEQFHGGRLTLYSGDCLAILDQLAENSIDAVVCDPPYHLTSIVKRFGAANAAPAKPGTDGAFARASRGFMGKEWDGGDVAFRPETWAKVLRVLKPGGHLVAFAGTRGYHRMAVAIEDAGFELRDMIAWIYGTGFPKSHDVAKGVDKAAGAKRPIIAPHRGAIGTNKTRVEQGYRPNEVAVGNYTRPATPEAAQWQGWGTALKPAIEPIALARKPLSEKTVAANVLKWGTGALNIDATRIGTSKQVPASASGRRQMSGWGLAGSPEGSGGLDPALGRWPANVCHDASDEVVAAFPGDRKTGKGGGAGLGYHGGEGAADPSRGFGDSGSAARFFYSAKASKAERAGSKHPTVKPIALMRWLCRLVTPPGGTVLDPFGGSGTTGEAAFRDGFRAILCERESEYQADIRRRFEGLGDPPALPELPAAELPAIAGADLVAGPAAPPARPRAPAPVRKLETLDLFARAL